MYSLNNAIKYFDLSILEKDIILSHMFPLGKRVPKYKESWLVDAVDDIVSIYERTYTTGKKLTLSKNYIRI